MTASWLETLLAALGLGGPHLEESRSLTRIRCNLSISVTTEARHTVQGQTVNINSRGITAELKRPVRKGDAVTVELWSIDRDPDAPPGRFLRLPARVIWTRKGSDGMTTAGFEFTGFDGPGLDHVLGFLRQELAVPVLDDRNKRRFRRVSTRWTVDYQVAGHERRQAIVKDISPCGCMLLSRSPLLQWTNVTLDIRPDGSSPAIAAQAVVRRCVRRRGEDWWEIACPMVHMSDADRSRLESAIERHLRKRN